jgi:hypothetical protein
VTLKALKGQAGRNGGSAPDRRGVVREYLSTFSFAIHVFANAKKVFIWVSLIARF